VEDLVVLADLARPLMCPDFAQDVRAVGDPVHLDPYAVGKVEATRGELGPELD